MTAVVSVQDAVVRFTHVNALNGVSIRVPKGSCFGVVGESGSGKTTLMRAILGLQRLNAGSIVLSNVAQGSSARERARIVQAIFQDPASSLSPRRSVAQALDEVAELLGEARESLGKRTHAMLRRLGLSPAVIDSERARRRKAVSTWCEASSAHCQSSTNSTTGMSSAAMRTNSSAKSSGVCGGFSLASACTMWWKGCSGSAPRSLSQ